MNQRAQDFLDRFRRADRDDRLLDALTDDHDGLGAAMAEAPDDLLAMATAAGVVGGPPVDLHPDSFASAACDRSGMVTAADARFRDWLGGIDPLAAVVRTVGADRPCVSAIADDRTGRPVAVAAATLAVARRWPLAPEVRAALDKGNGEFAVVAFRPGRPAWDHGARAFGLSPQESRLAEALARRGDLQRAAADVGVAYETARKLVGTAMRKTGAARQTDLVSRVLAISAGALHVPEDSPALFADLFGLNRRQADLAQAVAHGATREAAARALGVSKDSAKTDMKVVFQACGVANAVDLARIVAEVDALAGLSTACSVDIEPPGTAAEPLRLIARRGRPGRIAVNDHGPARGRPLLLFHTGVSGRHQPPRFIAALQAAGWRPVAFDRAGYGLTDPADGCPYAAAAADALDVLDALAIDRATLLARSGSTAAITVAAAHPQRIAGGVLIAPDPPFELDSRNSGLMGRGKALFFGSAPLAAAFARILSRRTSSAMIERMLRQSVAGSAIDEAALNDAENMAALVRGSRQSALGMHGFLAEMQAHGRGARPPRLVTAAHWIVLTGEHDPLYGFAETEAYWRDLLPGAAMVTVPGGGRFLQLTHPEAVVDALARCLTGE